MIPVKGTARMNHSLTMLLQRLQTTVPASQVTFTRDELNYPGTLCIHCSTGSLTDYHHPRLRSGQPCY